MNAISSSEWSNAFIDRDLSCPRRTVWIKKKQDDQDQHCYKNTITNFEEIFHLLGSNSALSMFGHIYANAQLRSLISAIVGRIQNLFFLTTQLQWHCIFLTGDIRQCGKLC